MCCGICNGQWRVGRGITGDYMAVFVSRRTHFYLRLDAVFNFIAYVDVDVDVIQHFQSHRDSKRNTFVKIASVRLADNGDSQMVPVLVCGSIFSLQDLMLYSSFFHMLPICILSRKGHVTAFCRWSKGQSGVAQISMHGINWREPRKRNYQAFMRFPSAQSGRQGKAIFQFLTHPD